MFKTKEEKHSGTALLKKTPQMPYQFHQYCLHIFCHSQPLSAIPSAWAQKLSSHFFQKQKTKLSQTAAGPGVGAIEEESQDANGRSARQETNGDQRKPWRFATCRGHAHLHSTALSESGGLCQGSSLMLRAATQHLRSCEALTWQQHVGGACHHSQHQQVGATCHDSEANVKTGLEAERAEATFKTLHWKRKTKARLSVVKTGEFKVYIMRV